MNILNFEQFNTLFEQNCKNSMFWYHPFFEYIKKNSDKEILKIWALQAGRIDEVFSLVLQNMINNPAIPTIYHEPLIENLNDENGNGIKEQEHFTLFKNVLTVLKISEEEYRKARLTVGTQLILDSLIHSSKDENSLKILSLMASEEIICPNEFPVFLDAMKKYGTNEDLYYFNVHIEADINHSNDLIKLCYLAAGKNRDKQEEVFEWQKVDIQNNIYFYDSLMKFINY